MKLTSIYQFQVDAVRQQASSNQRAQEMNMKMDMMFMTMMDKWANNGESPEKKRMDDLESKLAGITDILERLVRNSQ